MRPRDEEGSILLPRQWAAQADFCRVGKNRRLAKDRERKIEISIGWVLVANMGLMTRGLTRLFL